MHFVLEARELKPRTEGGASTKLEAMFIQTDLERHLVRAQRDILLLHAGLTGHSEDSRSSLFRGFGPSTLVDQSFPF